MATQNIKLSSSDQAVKELEQMASDATKIAALVSDINDIASEIDLLTQTLQTKKQDHKTI